YLDQDVVIIDFLALVRIITCPRDRIGVGASSAAHKISDAPVLVAFIVVDVTGKDHEARPQFLLLLFEISGQLLLARTGTVSASKGLFIARARIGRMMKHNEDECRAGREMV